MNDLPHEYFRRAADRMRAELEQVRLLLTEPRAHATDIGALCENAMRTALRRTLPERFGVAAGTIVFLRPKPGFPAQSEPLDTIVYDCLNYGPIERFGEYVVVPSPAVLGVIEVKADLTAARAGDGHLGKALRQLRVLDYYEDEPNRPLGYVFGFDGATIATVEAQWDATKPRCLKSICVLERDWCLVDTSHGRVRYEEYAFYYFYYYLLQQLCEVANMRFLGPPDILT